MIRELIFVDTETTGLDAETCDTVELSWARLTGPIHTLYFGVEEVPEFIDELIGFTKRGIANMLSTELEFSEFINASTDSTLVSANPSFDESFIKKESLWRFHYRKLDIESYAMAALKLNYVPGMKNIYDELVIRGHALPEPDHTSAGDVAAMRESYYILREL